MKFSIRTIADAYKSDNPLYTYFLVGRQWQDSCFCIFYSDELNEVVNDCFSVGGSSGSCDAYFM